MRVGMGLAVTVVLWGAAFGLIKSAGAVYGGGELALVRFIVAGTVLGLAGVVMRVRVPRKGRDVLAFFGTGLSGVAIYHPFLNYGEKVVSAGVASLLINSAPLWTAILASFLLREKITRRKGMGILVSFVGVAILAVGSKGRIEIEPAALLVVGSAVCAAIYVIIQKKFLSGWGAVEFTLWTVWAGVILMLPVFGLSSWNTVRTAPIERTLEVVFLGVFPAALAYMTFAYATVRMPASRVMTFMYLIPPVAMAFAWMYEGEVPTWLSALGGALAIGGVAIVNSARESRAEAGEKQQPVIAVEEG